MFSQPFSCSVNYLSFVQCIVFHGVVNCPYYIDFLNLLRFSLSVIHCPALTPPEYGFFVQDVCNNHFEAACGVRCQPGFELHGTGIRLCQADSTWSGTPASCTGKVHTSSVAFKKRTGPMVAFYTDNLFFSHALQEVPRIVGHNSDLQQIQI